MIERFTRIGIQMHFGSCDDLWFVRAEEYDSLEARNATLQAECERLMEALGDIRAAKVPHWCTEIAAKALSPAECGEVYTPPKVKESAAIDNGFPRVSERPYTNEVKPEPGCGCALRKYIDRPVCETFQENYDKHVLRGHCWNCNHQRQCHAGEGGGDE